MTQALSKLLTFEEFLEWYPDDGRRYELIEGESVYQLVEGEYQVSQFRGVEQVLSPTFPALALTAAQVLQA